MGINLNDNNFKQEVLEAELPVLVDFWAVWCGPCLRLAPVIDRVAESYRGKLKVCKLNVDEAPQIAERYEIMSIPTIIFFKDGKAVHRVVGALSQKELEAALKPYM